MFGQMVISKHKLMVSIWLISKAPELPGGYSNRITDFLLINIMQNYQARVFEKTLGQKNNYKEKILNSEKILTNLRHENGNIWFQNK